MNASRLSSLIATPARQLRRRQRDWLARSGRRRLGTIGMEQRPRRDRVVALAGSRLPPSGFTARRRNDGPLGDAQSYRDLGREEGVADVDEGEDRDADHEDVECKEGSGNRRSAPPFYGAARYTHGLRESQHVTRKTEGAPPCEQRVSRRSGEKRRNHEIALLAHFRFIG